MKEREARFEGLMRLRAQRLIRGSLFDHLRYMRVALGHSGSLWDHVVPTMHLCAALMGPKSDNMHGTPKAGCIGACWGDPMFISASRGGHLGFIWAYLGVVGAHLDPSGGHSADIWTHRGDIWAIQGVIWGRLGGIWGTSGVSWGSMAVPWRAMCS